MPDRALVLEGSSLVPRPAFGGSAATIDKSPVPRPAFGGAGATIGWCRLEDKVFVLRLAFVSAEELLEQADDEVTAIRGPGAMVVQRSELGSEDLGSTCDRIGIPLLAVQKCLGLL